MIFVLLSIMVFLFKRYVVNYKMNVRESVENMTGLNVVEVNVKVEGVAFKEDEIEEQQQQRLK